MILVGSQRGGARQLAAHLLNGFDNDHVTVHELRGFVAEDLRGALIETQAVAKGTRCKQYMFSLSLNPPKDAEVSIDALMNALERAEAALGLTGQPRAVVIHEKNGRRHLHAAFSRIDANRMRAINLPFFKSRLRDLSKELYLEHGWELPEGHRTNGWKNPLNFSLAEWQQAKRLDLDPREIKQIFQTAWAQSDNLASFGHALEEHGYYLARGDRRGVVAIDIHEVYSVARWAGIRTKALSDKIGHAERLPSVDERKADIRTRMSERLRTVLDEDRRRQREDLKPLVFDLRRTVVRQRAERADLNRKQEARWRRENAERAGRFRRGLGVVLDVLTGRLFATRRQNEREAWEGVLRDRAQRERLRKDQQREREPIHRNLDALRAQHREERLLLARRIAEVLRVAEKPGRSAPERSHARVRSHDLDFEP